MTMQEEEGKRRGSCREIENNQRGKEQSGGVIKPRKKRTPRRDDLN